MEGGKKYEEEVDEDEGGLLFAAEDNDEDDVMNGGESPPFPRVGRNPCIPPPRLLPPLPRIPPILLCWFGSAPGIDKDDDEVS
jgi:hypothetical protein